MASLRAGTEDQLARATSSGIARPTPVECPALASRATQSPYVALAKTDIAASMFSRVSGARLIHWVSSRPVATTNDP